MGPSVDLAVSSDAAFDPVAEFIARNESLQADKKRLEASTGALSLLD